ncbi:MAG: hypothetical protein WDW38_004363 [Sanguina aurantia]
MTVGSAVAWYMGYWLTVLVCVEALLDVFMLVTLAGTVLPMHMYIRDKMLQTPKVGPKEAQPEVAPPSRAGRPIRRRPRA